MRCSDQPVVRTTYLSFRCEFVADTAPQHTHTHTHRKTDYDFTLALVDFPTAFIRSQRYLTAPCKDESEMMLQHAQLPSHCRRAFHSFIRAVVRPFLDKYASVYQLGRRGRPYRKRWSGRTSVMNHTSAHHIVHTIRHMNDTLSLCARPPKRPFTISFIGNGRRRSRYTETR